jgi:RNase adapter protein RapZ
MTVNTLDTTQFDTPNNSKEIVLVTGLSGSGKSIALHALEDAGFFCVDNLPPELLVDLVNLESNQSSGRRLAIGIDVRSASSLYLLPTKIQILQNSGCNILVLYLESSVDILVRRFSETRRKHPLSQRNAVNEVSQEHHALVDAIHLEKNLLTDLRERAYVIDSSVIFPAQLQSYIKDIISSPQSQMLIVFESFSYKRGIPMDADFVFDVRMLPNPYYDLALRHLTGKDIAVCDFFSQSSEMDEMAKNLESFLTTWLLAMAKNHRSYVTVAIGCTGGQHRSVYLSENLFRLFKSQWTTLIRHRELDHL